MQYEVKFINKDKGNVYCDVVFLNEIQILMFKMYMEDFECVSLEVIK